MGDSDAEWVGVDFEFGQPRTPTTPRPRPRPPPPQPQPPLPRPRQPPLATEPPHDAPEVAGRANTTSDNTVAVAAGSVVGVLSVVMLVLLVYMLVLRRKLTKAKDSGKASKYQLRVEDVAHITNLDETSNTYVNTTDLQKLVASVRAKGKSADRLPTPPRLQHQTPKPYRPPPTEPRQADSVGRGDREVVVVRAPMPAPHDPVSPPPVPAWAPAPPVSEPEAVYWNLSPPAPPTTPASRVAKVEAPKIAPPPPPAKLKNTVKSCESESECPRDPPVSPTAVARPAPPPPALAKPAHQQPAPAVATPTPPKTHKPTPPPVAFKPTKVPQPAEAAAPTCPAPVAAKPAGPKPTPPTLPKPGVLKKGKALPPLKMALLPSLSKSSLDNVSTPDTSIIELTPDSSPTVEEDSGSKSISAKIAFLEGKMKTPGTPSRPLGPRT